MAVEGESYRGLPGGDGQRLVGCGPGSLGESFVLGAMRLEERLAGLAEPQGDEPAEQRRLGQDADGGPVAVSVVAVGPHAVIAIDQPPVHPPRLPGGHARVLDSQRCLLVHAGRAGGAMVARAAR